MKQLPDLMPAQYHSLFAILPIQLLRLLHPDVTVFNKVPLQVILRKS